MAKRMQAEDKKMGHCCFFWGGGLEPPELTPSGWQVTVQCGQWTTVKGEPWWYSYSHQSGISEALILNILWLFQARKDCKTDLAHLEACAHWRPGCKNRQVSRNSDKVTKYINTYEWVITFTRHLASCDCVCKAAHTLQTGAWQRTVARTLGLSPTKRSTVAVPETLVYLSS